MTARDRDGATATSRAIIPGPSDRVWGRPIRSRRKPSFAPALASSTAAPQATTTQPEGWPVRARPRPSSELRHSRHDPGPGHSAFHSGPHHGRTTIRDISRPYPRGSTVVTPETGPVWMDPNAGRPARQYQWSIGFQREMTRNLVGGRYLCGEPGRLVAGASAC